LSLDSMTILIAGPLASNADVVRDAIDGTGAMIERDGAGDHGTILRILEGRRVDCAVIDLAVAAAEGGALVPTLRARGIDTPILLVSDGGGADRDDSQNVENVVDCLALASLSPAGLRFAVLMSARLGRSERRAREAERRLAS
jgi:CheY-like chemotaxis protein